ncbi:MAG: hypothetical protein RJB66_395 [Pseudomonadota bacterium]|jgi:hypothetical protein
MKFFKIYALSALFLFGNQSAMAAKIGEEVELTSGAVTALSCAKRALAENNLDLLSSCPLSEVSSGYVVFDVAEKAIYQISEKNVFLFELERAFGGGSIDFTGKVAKVIKSKKDQLEINVVDVSEYSITQKAKPGSFKGCL